MNNICIIYGTGSRQLFISFPKTESDTRDNCEMYFCTDLIIYTLRAVMGEKKETGSFAA